MTATRVPTTDGMKRRLRDAFQRHLGIDRLTARQLLTSAKLQDKAYELAALIEVMAQLKRFRPSLNFLLQQGSSVVFRAKGGPIERGRGPYIRIMEGVLAVGELWVDIECLAISAGPGAKTVTGRLYGKCHELDIVLVAPGTNGRPLPHEIFLAVEAKHREFNKALLKEILGVRREMTMRSASIAYDAPHWFVWWAAELPARPPSGLVAFCSSVTVGNYSAPADYWGIRMEHLPF